MRRRISGWLIVLMGFGLLAAGELAHGWGNRMANTFAVGAAAYEETDFTAAAEAFAVVIDAQASSGAWLNLGNAEWQRGRVGAAIIAWERAAQVDPFVAAARDNLKFARREAQLESPDWTWCEVAAGWLPERWWAWLGCGSFWLAAGAIILPSVLRWRRSAGQQAVAALGLGVFLLALPANYGVTTRERMAFVLEAETPLRSTPTAHAESVTTLAAGEPARIVRERGDYWLLRTRRASGWARKGECGLVSDALVATQSSGASTDKGSSEPQ
jgi:tetratricopeptide (TPR) repeat protein